MSTTQMIILVAFSATAFVGGSLGLVALAVHSVLNGEHQR